MVFPWARCTNNSTSDIYQHTWGVYINTPFYLLKVYLLMVWFILYGFSREIDSDFFHNEQREVSFWNFTGWSGYCVQNDHHQSAIDDPVVNILV